MSAFSFQFEYNGKPARIDAGVANGAGQVDIVDYDASDYYEFIITADTAGSGQEIYVYDSGGTAIQIVQSSVVDGTTFRVFGYGLSLDSNGSDFRYTVLTVKLN